MFKRILLLVWCIFLLVACQNEKSTQTGGKIFELMSTSHTGVTFKNTITETLQNNFLTNNYIFSGGGVAVGDLNNDGLEDLVFVSNEKNPVIYLNEKNFSFRDISANSGISMDEGWSTGVHLIDINQDGFQDIYICRAGEHIKDPEKRKNLLYINNKDLSFTEAASTYGLDDASRTMMAAFFDYDLDGDLDVYLLNTPSLSKGMNLKTMMNARTNPSIVKNERFQSDKFYRNDNNKFIDVSEEVGVTNWGKGLGISVGDVNKDGYPDVFITNDFEIDNFYYENNGDGTFSEKCKERFPHVSFFAMGVDMADINNDSYLDVFEVEMLPEKRKRAVLNMQPMDRGKFEFLNASGLSPQYMRNSLHLNRGNGYFTDIAQFAGVNKTDWSWGALLVDLDNDGMKDIYVTNGIARDMKDRDFQHKGNKQSENSSGKLTIEEMNQLVPTNRVANYAFKNKGDLTFEKTATEWGLDFKGFSNGVATVDLDQDGDLDMIVNNIGDYPLIYKNLSVEKGAHFMSIAFEGPKTNPQGIGNKVKITTQNGIQYEELFPVAGFQSCSETKVHFGLGDMDLVESMVITWFDGKKQELQNVPADQRLTIKYEDAQSISSIPSEEKTFLKEMTAEVNIDFKHVEKYYDDFNTEILLPHKMSQHGPKLTTGDVNADGLEDFYIGGAANQAGVLYLQTKNGSFSKTQNTSFSTDQQYEDIGSLFFDMDGDKDLDLYVVSGSNEFEKDTEMYQDRLYKNDGNGNFSRVQLPVITSSGSCVSAGDIDGDGDLDLFVGGRVVPQKYPTNPQSYILLNEEGLFVNATSKIASALQQVGMVTAADWNDYDGDGDQDLIIAGEWMSIEVWENNDGTLSKIEGVGLDDTEGWWNSLSPMDIDGDGDMDYIAGNIGLNHKFKASKEKPFQVFSNDFDNTGTYDIVLAFYQDEELYPVRGRDCSSEQMPFLTEKFPDFESFGEANLIDVYGDELDKSLHKNAVEFASVLLINEGGRYSIKKLPTTAQLSSVNGAVLRDVTGNGANELVLVGNMFKTEAETSRADGSIGTVLTIDASYNMESLPVNETGFFAPGDAKDIKLVQSNGDKSYILVGNNHGKIQVFK